MKLNACPLQSGSHRSDSHKRRLNSVNKEHSRTFGPGFAPVLLKSRYYFSKGNKYVFDKKIYSRSLNKKENFEFTQI